MNIYVGNLPYNVTEKDLQQAFAAFGQVASASIIKDQFSGRSKGFGFVEMPVKEEAQAAIAGMNGKMMGDRALNVNEARPRADNRRDGSSRGGGNRGGDRGKSGGRSRY